MAIIEKSRNLCHTLATLVAVDVVGLVIAVSCKETSLLSISRLLPRAAEDDFTLGLLRVTGVSRSATK